LDGSDLTQRRKDAKKPNDLLGVFAPLREISFSYPPSPTNTNPGIVDECLKRQVPKIAVRRDYDVGLAAKLKLCRLEQHALSV